MALERGADGGARRKQSVLSKLLRSVSALSLGAIAATGVAFAQNADDTEDEIVVTGIRGSLRSSQEIKRDADVFVDSVTAEDIGALPDRSVSEALQRIPGVAIDRFAAGVDPDHFSTEGSGVVVRGLNFVRSELNGRDTFTANNGRALSFADVAPELMSGVDVFKSPSANMIEGGLSGIVNLRTRVPFDDDGRVIAGSLEYSYGDFAEEGTPTYSALYSDRWDTGIGEFGLLLNYVDSQLISRSDGTQASNFGCRTTIDGSPAPAVAVCPNGDPGVWFPRGAAFRTQTNDRQRIGQAVAAQWESPDDVLLATFQYLRSESNLSWTEHAIEIATDNVTSNGDSRPVLGTSFDYDGQGVFTDGTITGSQGWRDDQFGLQRIPLYGLQSNNIRRDVDQTYVTEDMSFNLRFTPTDNLRITFDYQKVDASVRNLDVGIWGSTFQNLELHLNGDDPPDFTFLPPSNDGTVVDCTATPGQNCPSYFNPPHADFSDPFNSFWRSAMDHSEDSDGEEEAMRLDVEYDFENAGWIESLNAGVRWAQRDQTTRFSTYNWGVLSEIWGGGGPVWFDQPVDGVDGGSGGTPSSTQTELFPWSNFFRGDVPFPLQQNVPFYAHNIVNDYDTFVAFASGVAHEWRNFTDCTSGAAGWVPLEQRCNVLSDSPGGRYLQQEINPQHEDSDAFYAMLNFGNEDRTIRGNIGVRYVTLDRTAGGFRAFTSVAFDSDADCTLTQDIFLAGPDGILGTADDPDPSTFNPTNFCGLTPAVRQQVRDWSNGALTPNDQDSEFDYWLPSLNVKWEFAEDMLFRFGASRGISYPDVGLTRNYFNMALNLNDAGSIAANGGRPVALATVGNPTLSPIQATSYDASFEWYFADVGQLTFSVFYKELEDVIVNGTNRVPFTNNGATFDVLLTQPVNASESGTVQGFEIAYQQTYDFLPAPFDGLGIQANYTFIDASGVPQDTLSSTDPDVGAGRQSNVDTSTLPLQGLSEHNFNFVAFYENGPWEGRLAWNWRSEFLLTTRDVIVPFAPIMNEDTGQLDGSIFFRVNDNFRFGVQGVNLLNEVTQTSQVLNDDGLRTGRSWFMNDRRFTFVLRAQY
jgi:TonB-dependent receptor